VDDDPLAPKPPVGVTRGHSGARSSPHEEEEEEMAATHAPDVTPSEDAPPDPTPPVTAEVLRAVERARLRALVSADIEVAAMLHADDFQLVNPAGAVFSKANYLMGVATGRIDYRAWEITSAIEVRLHGEAAVLRYRSHIDIAVDGAPFSLGCWHTDTYELRDGHWQVVWSQATAIEQPSESSRASGGQDVGA